MQRFGTSKALDFILNNDLTCIINIGMGATDPEDRLKRFMGATQAWVAMSAQLPPDANLEEIKNELYGCAGYRDPKRFFTGQKDPRIVQLTQAVQQAQQQIQQLTQQLQTELGFVQEKRSIDQKHAQLQVEEIRVQSKTGGDPMLAHHMDSAETAVKLGIMHDKAQAEIRLKWLKEQYKMAEGAQRLELDRQIAAVELGIEHMEAENKHKRELKKIETAPQKLSHIESRQ